MNQLPYCTENGHEYFTNSTGKTVFINCHNDNDSEVMANPISPKDLQQMIETAKTFGIEKIELHTNYGIDLHSRKLKTNPIYKGLKICKPCNS